MTDMGIGPAGMNSASVYFILYDNYGGCGDGQRGRPEINAFQVKVLKMLIILYFRVSCKTG